VRGYDGVFVIGRARRRWCITCQRWIPAFETRDHLCKEVEPKLFLAEIKEINDEDLMMHLVSFKNKRTLCDERAERRYFVASSLMDWWNLCFECQERWERDYI